jgi:integrase
MSVTKRGKHWTLILQPEGRRGKQMWVKTNAQTKGRAREMEQAILTALRSGDYHSLDPDSRAVCVRVFENQGWQMPPDLKERVSAADSVTLWKAVELFLNYPSIKECGAKQRYIYALKHVVRKWGKERFVTDVWIPDVRTYQADRLAEGAKPQTVNWETSTLRKLFGVMEELRVVDSNPVRLVEQLSRRGSERQAYLSKSDVEMIAENCPEWFRPAIWTAYFTGMRRGEVFALKRQNIRLSDRIIGLSADQTKERHGKRIPIHVELVPIFRELLRVPALNTEHLFLLRDERGVRAPSDEAVKNPWRRACKALNLPKPLPRFHDLRHTWRANARRSGIDWVIAERILGHGSRQLAVTERYGYISDEELIRAIDSMEFDNGDTVIHDTRNKKTVL